ncbi:MAG: PrsW family glutamic-type intramembrane protease [Eggerthellaceae bacterium]|nr:PrsW family glutamic-type intramembrane protease [Eggerthellaceae bacterium]
MLYIENIFVCLVAPLVVLLFFVRGPRRLSIFGVVLGMVACLLSAYVSAFFAQLYGADVVATAAEITPVVEEFMKFLPVVFILAVFDPKDEALVSFALVIGISFATFENVCYLIENGASSISLLFLRGFGTGAMHLACAMLAVYGLVQLRHTTSRLSTRIVGGFSMLCVAISFHELFNVLLAAEGVLMYVALAAPIVTCAVILARRRVHEKKRATDMFLTEPID